MANLSISVTLKAFDEVSKKFEAITKAGTRLSKQFEDNKAKLDALNKQGRKLESFNKLNTQVKNTAQTLDKARERVRQLHGELQKGSAGRSAAQMNKLRGEYARAKTAAASLQRTYDGQRGRLLALRGELRAAGINTAKFRTEQERLNSTAKSLTATMERQAKRLQARTNLSQNLSDAKGRYQGRVAVADKVGDFGKNMTIAGAVAAGTVGAGVKGLLETATTFERFEAILKTTEGSAEKARDALDWVSDFAAKTPYELDEITDSFVKMRSYGLDPTNGLLQTLGDTSASMGKDLSQAVEAIADAVTGENERLKEFGIKASKNKKTGNFEYRYTDKDGVEQIKTANAQSRAEIEKALTEIWQEKFTGGMENLANTFEGQIDKLKDVWLEFKLAIMSHGLFDAMKDRLGQVSDKIEELKKSGKFDEFAKNIGKGLMVLFDIAWKAATVVAKIVLAIGEFANNNPKLTQMATTFAGIATAVAVIGGPILIVISLLMKFGAMLMFVGGAISAFSGFAKAIGIFSAVGKAIGLVGTAIKAVWAVMMANPIILAIALLAGAAYAIYVNWETLGPFFKNLWANIIDGVAALWSRITAIWQNIKTSVMVIAMILWESIKSLFATGIGALIFIITNFSPVGLFIQMFSAVLSYLSGLTGQFTAFGANIIEGLKNGIMSRFESVIGAARKVVGSIKSVFTGTKGMDIHSPSRVFKAYGGYMMAGLDQGISHNARNVIDTTGALTAKIKDSMAHAVSPTGGRLTATVGARAELGGVLAGSNIVININGADDPQAVAQAVKRELSMLQANQSARERRRMMD